MKNKFIMFAIALAVLALPLSSFAATYVYVDKAGALRSVSANTASEAFMIAPEIHPNSGVMIITGTTTIWPLQVR